MNEKILLAHGGGGALSRDLIRELFLGPLYNPFLAPLDDAALLDESGRLAFTTDSYVVRPLFFPGGDIGKLSVCGTVNDLAMMGAKPAYLCLSVIIEEGLEVKQLQTIVESIRTAATEACIDIVTGDTKVVEKGKADRLFINTAGIGRIPTGIDISSSNILPGDHILLSGTIGDHGASVLGQRESFQFETPIESDCAPLHHLVAEMMSASEEIHALKDPTRGGLAAALNEMAEQSNLGIEIEEQRLPVQPAVQSLCGFLGLDVLHLANEGKLVAAVAGKDTLEIISRMHRHEYGRRAAFIGKFVERHPGKVVMKTRIGSRRIVSLPQGELVPRIC
ncbi:MAG: hydrogenase expression/formation protein HypE [Desulfobacterales bacterium]